MVLSDRSPLATRANFAPDALSVYQHTHTRLFTLLSKTAFTAQIIHLFGLLSQ